MNGPHNLPREDSVVFNRYVPFEGKTKPVETTPPKEKLSSPEITKTQQEQPPAAKATGPSFMKAAIGPVLIGTGTTLQYLGIAGSVAVLPLTLAGGALGAIAAKIADKAKVEPEHKNLLLPTGLIVGSLGAGGLVVAGTALKEYGKDVKEKQAEKQAAKNASQLIPLFTDESKRGDSTRDKASTQSSTRSESFTSPATPTGKPLETLTPTPAAPPAPPDRQSLQSQIAEVKSNLKELANAKMKAKEALADAEHAMPKSRSKEEISIEMDRASLQHNDQIINNIHEANKGYESYKETSAEYERLGSEKNGLDKQEDFVNSLMNIHSNNGIRQIHELRKENKIFQKQIAQNKEDLAGIRKNDKKLLADLEEAKNNLSSVEAEEKAATAQLTKLQLQLDGINIQEEINKIIAPFVSSPVADQIRVLENATRTQTRYRDAGIGREQIEEKNQFIKALNTKITELQDQKRMEDIDEFQEFMKGVEDFLGETPLVKTEEEIPKDRELPTITEGILKDLEAEARSEEVQASKKTEAGAPTSDEIYNQAFKGFPDEAEVPPAAAPKTSPDAKPEEDDFDKLFGDIEKGLQGLDEKFDEKGNLRL